MKRFLFGLVLAASVMFVMGVSDSHASTIVKSDSGYSEAVDNDFDYSFDFVAIVPECDFSVIYNVSVIPEACILPEKLTKFVQPKARSPGNRYWRICN